VRRTKKVIAAEVLEAASQGHFNELTSLASTYSHVALFNNSSNAAAWEQLMQQAQQQPQPQPATAADTAAPASQQDQQQQSQQQQPGQEGGAVGRASSLSLCRSSGLGSFRQQVWLHSQSQSVFDAEAVTTQQQDDNPPATSLPASQPPAAAAADDRTAAGTNGSTGSRDAPELQAAAVPAPQPLTPEVQQAQLKVLANVGYACLCQTMRQYEIFNSRDCVKETRDAPDGLHKVSELALQNAR
jgi:UV DNA damage endonuclease